MNSAQLMRPDWPLRNLRSLIESPPTDWDLQRRRDYFEWAKRVVDRCRGVNPRLEAAFDQAYREGVASLEGAAPGGV